MGRTGASDSIFRRTLLGYYAEGQEALCVNGKISPGSLGLQLIGGVVALWLTRGMCHVCCSGMEEDSTPSEEWWIYFGLKLAYGELV